jgi:hypothetical protein
MRLNHTRSWQRTLDQARYSQLIASHYPKVSPEELRRRALAARQPDPPGAHCGFCGELKPLVEPCPNDGPSWPHPKGPS